MEGRSLVFLCKGPIVCHFVFMSIVFCWVGTLVADSMEQLSVYALSSRADFLLLCLNVFFKKGGHNSDECEGHQIAFHTPLKALTPPWHPTQPPLRILALTY